PGAPRLPWRKILAVVPLAMAGTQRIDLRQAQSLVMTPQLQQAIKLLELSNQDLVAYVEGEIEQNPLLDRGEEERGSESSADAPENLTENFAAERDDIARDSGE